MSETRDWIAVLPRLRPIAGDAELRAIEAAAHAEGHGVVMPTHAVWKQGECVGYAGFGSAALMTAWVSRHVRARETVYLLNAAENVAACATGQRVLVVPCEVSSPFYGVLGELGYQKLCDNGAIFVKRL